MAQDWSELGVNVAAAAVGVLLPLLLTRGGGGGRSVDGSTVHGDVNQGDDKRRYKVHIDNRVIKKITTTVRIDARQPVPAGPASPPPRPSASGSASDDSQGALVVTGIVALLCVVGYVSYREVVTTVAMAVQLFALSAAVSALVVARLRSVRYGGWVTAQLLLDLVMGGVALLGLRWLTDPPFTGALDVRAVLDGGKGLGVAEIVGQFGFPAITFLLYQLLGLVVSSLAMAFVVLHAVKVYVAAGIAVRTSNDPTYLPGGVRRWLLRVGGTPSWCWGTAVFTTAVGALLVSGFGFDLLHQVQEWAARRNQVPGAGA